jgi:hypothetical protein
MRTVLEAMAEKIKDIPTVPNTNSPEEDIRGFFEMVLNGRIKIKELEEDDAAGV